MKCCSKCGLHRPLSEFTRDSSKSSGLYSSCKMCIRISRKGYFERQKAIKAEYDRRYAAKNRDKRNRYYREYYYKNKKRIFAYWKERSHTSIVFRLKKRLRARIYKALKGNRKAGHVIGDLGCTIAELKRYIESQFRPGMTWENWGRTGWHIDHIVPLAVLDLTNLEQFRKACHYSNLQPLWAKDNRRKGSEVRL